MSKAPKNLVTRSAGSVSYNEEAGTVDIVYSTGARRELDGMWEELVVSEEAIDATRLDAGAVSLIVDHVPYGLPIGRVIGHRIENGQAIATVKLSEAPENAGIVADIRAGIIRQVSVGYMPKSFTDTEQDGVITRTVTSWEPWEISLVVIPADPAAHIRSAGASPTRRSEVTMDPEELLAQAQAELEAAQAALAEVAETGDETAIAEAQAAVESAQAEVDAAQAAIEAEDDGDDNDSEDDAETRAAEQTRVAAILAYATRNQLPAAMIAEHITARRSIQEVRDMTTSTRAARSAGPVNTARTRQQRDLDRQGLHTRAAAAFFARMSGDRAAIQEAGDLRSMRIAEIARLFLNESGATRMSDRDILTRSTGMGMLTTSDFSFTSAVTGAVDRRVRQIAEAIEIPLEPLVTTTYVRDDRQVETYSAGGFPELLETPEGAEYEAGSIVTDAGTFKIRKFGRVLILSLEAMIRDDMRLLDSAIRGTASAGIKLKQKLIREAFNAKMADGKTLFHATRGNLIADRLTLAGLSKARAALRKLKGVDGEPRNLAGKFLIVSPDDETVAQQLVSPITAAVTGEVNVFAASLTVIVDPMLSAGEWILAADPAMGDSIEYAELEGYEGVNVADFFNPAVDGMSWRARAFGGAHPTGMAFIKSTGTAA